MTGRSMHRNKNARYSMKITHYH